jgi:hypothetical protein
MPEACEVVMIKKLLVKLTACAALAFLFSANAAAHTGFGIAVDAQGRVIFLDSGRAVVWRIELDGKLTALARGIHGDNLMLDAEGNLYVQHVNQTLWKIAARGSVSRAQMPARNAAPGRVGSLDEILAIDAAGNLYVRSGNEFYNLSPQILKITPQGEVVLLAGSEPGHADGTGTAARFRHVRSAAWGPDSALYVTDDTSVRRVTLTGEVTTLVPPHGSIAEAKPVALENGPWRKDKNPAGFGALLGIAVDRQGAVYVADPDSFRVVRIDPQGHLTTVAETRPPWKPTGVTVGDGVFVLEQKFIPVPLITGWFDTHRVRHVTADGESVVLATVGGGGGYILSAFVAACVLGIWGMRRRQRPRQTMPARGPSFSKTAAV